LIKQSLDKRGLGVDPLLELIFYQSSLFKAHCASTLTPSVTVNTNNFFVRQGQIRTEYRQPIPFVIAVFDKNQYTLEVDEGKSRL